jgi:hypothetical protein
MVITGTDGVTVRWLRCDPVSGAHDDTKEARSAKPSQTIQVMARLLLNKLRQGHSHLPRFWRFLLGAWKSFVLILPAPDENLALAA